MYFCVVIFRDSHMERIGRGRPFIGALELQKVSEGQRVGGSKQWIKTKIKVRPNKFDKTSHVC